MSPIDVLQIVNDLNTRRYSNSNGQLPIPPPSGPYPYLDVTGDNFATPIDALTVINFLNANGEGEGESASSGNANRITDRSPPTGTPIHIATKSTSVPMPAEGDESAVSAPGLTIGRVEYFATLPDNAEESAAEYEQRVAGIEVLDDLLDGMLEDLAVDIASL